MSQISTASNLQGPDLSNPDRSASKYFNNFFALDFSVGPANDAIVAYFEKYTGNQQSGVALAAAVIYTAKAQNLDPMSVLTQFQQLSNTDLTNYLAAFLNFSRAPTSTIGVKSQRSTTNPYVARTILP